MKDLPLKIRASVESQTSSSSEESESSYSSSSESVTQTEDKIDASSGPQIPIDSKKNATSVDLKIPTETSNGYLKGGGEAIPATAGNGEPTNLRKSITSSSDDSDDSLYYFSNKKEEKTNDLFTLSACFRAFVRPEVLIESNQIECTPCTKHMKNTNKYEVSFKS